jgi:hypothetical protein
MIRAGWAVFRRDVRAVVPARRIRTAVLVGGIVAVVLAALVLAGGTAWSWFDVGPIRAVLGSVAAGLATGCLAIAICPLGPLPTGQRLLRDSVEYSPPYRLAPYFARRNRLPVPPEERAAVLLSAERQRNWAIPSMIRSAALVGVFVFVFVALMSVSLFLGVGDPFLGWFVPVYSLAMALNGVDTLRRLGRIEQVRLAALAVPEPEPPAPAARRPHPRGSVLRLPEE